MPDVPARRSASRCTDYSENTWNTQSRGRESKPHILSMWNGLLEVLVSSRKEGTSKTEKELLAAGSKKNPNSQPAGQQTKEKINELDSNKREQCYCLVVPLSYANVLVLE